MSRFQDYFPGENILIEQTGWWMKGFLNVKTGTSVLTNQRVAFVEQKQISGGGLLGAVAVAASGINKPKLKVDLPFSNIKSWSQPKKIDILIETKTGETYKLRGVKYDEWDAKLKDFVK